MLNRVKTDLDLVKYTKKGFFTQNMRQIEKKIAEVCRKFNSIFFFVS